MSEFIDEMEAEEWAEFERLGRRAGAEIRTAPPDTALDDLERTMRRRATRRVVTGTFAILVLAVASWFVVRGHLGSDETPVDTTTAPTLPLPVGELGTWRAISNPAEAPAFVPSASWTGTEVIVIGLHGTDTPRVSADAYDVRGDSWRSLAPPPAELRDGVRTAWTGSTLLAVGDRGDAFSYDPSLDQWSRHTRPDAVVLEEGSPVAVSSRGALARSADGWWWFDATGNAWSSVPSPDPVLDSNASTIEGAFLDVLSPAMFVLAVGDAGRISYSVFNADPGEWSRLGAVDGPTSTRGGPFCRAANGRLVCLAEGFSTLDGVVVDVATGATSPFSMGQHGASLLLTNGTPWVGHAWSLLSARTATWEELPPLDGVDGFSVAIWTGRELLMFGGQSESGEPVDRFAAAYTPAVQP